MVDEIKKEKRHPFQKLQSDLADLIGATAAGERLPAEPDLAKQLGVSRATLREAMRTFEGQGIIRRRQGVGTFVVSHTQIIESGLEFLRSIESMAQAIGLEVSMGALSILTVDASPDVALSLKIAAGTPVIRISRVIYADNRPAAYLVDILPQDVLTAEELKEGFTGSVLDFLLQRGSPRLANSVTEIQAVAVPTEIARSLEIQRGDVLLRFVANLVAENGQVVDHSHSYFLPGYFRFQLVRRVG